MNDEGKFEVSVNVAVLRRFLTIYFNASELQNLCFDLEIDYESLPGYGKADKARELVAHVKRHGQIAVLLKECQRIRPDIDWPSVTQPNLSKFVYNEPNKRWLKTLDYIKRCGKHSRLMLIVKLFGIIAVFFSLVIILSKSPLTQDESIHCSFPDDNNKSGYIVVDDLQISSLKPTVGQQVTVTFRIRNEFDQALLITNLVAGGRGPNAHNLGWNAPQTDFPPVLDITLEPGEECVYSRARRFLEAGDYFVEPVKMGPDGKWSGIRPFLRISFEVRDLQAQQKNY